MADFDVILGSGLPVAENVGDSDFVFIIQAGETKIAPKVLFGSGGGGGGSSVAVVLPLVVSGSGSVVLEAETYMQEAIIIDVAGSYKVGTTVGGGEIIDDSYTGDFVTHPALGRYFESNTTIYFTGNFSIKLLLWLTA